MELYVLEELKKGNRGIVDLFVALEAKWHDFFAENEENTTAELADALTSFQYYIEDVSSDRYVGKQLMAWSALSHLYTNQDGFAENEELATRVIKAFLKSTCSGEVKAEARRAAKAYSLDIED